MIKAILSCKINDGMFDSEKLFTVTDVHNNRSQFFADNIFLVGNIGVEVRVIEMSDGKTLIELPGEPFHGYTKIMVNSSQLSII